MATRKVKSRAKKWQNEAVKFFYENAGYSYGKGETREQGRRRTARALATAEQYASTQGWVVDWELEEGVWEDFYGEGETAENVEQVVVAILKDANGKVLGSLGGITESFDSATNRRYRRVVEAELDLEAIPT